MAVGLTGGHIYPAKALAEQLGREWYQFLFVARSRSPLANKIIEAEGYPLLPIDVSGMPRKPTEALFKGPAFLWNQIKACALLWRAFRDWKPDVVIGFGGYVSFPAVVIAKVLGISTVVFEPNAKPGVANKVLFGLCDQVVCAFNLNIAKATLIAPPLRASMLQTKQKSKEECRKIFGLDTKSPCVLVFGGSQGARAINNAFTALVDRLRAENTPLSFIHVTGAADFEEVKNFYQSREYLNETGVVLSYLENMAEAYRAADLVIARSGAMTCLELLSLGIPSILVPLPRATQSHQLANAKQLADLGLAQIVEETGDLSQSLSVALKEILSKDRGVLGDGAKVHPAIKDTFKEVIEGLINHG